jgi:hypothetical protein
MNYGWIVLAFAAAIALALALPPTCSPMVIS